uniref:Uncharacterized protein n=1 Tax=Leishmania guyanensis TaxID=5670 RepID=A0A1E1IQW0_LEIGU|nr:Hypothetical protein BN36_1009970 [Leishmania guyanensis]
MCVRAKSAVYNSFLSTYCMPFNPFSILGQLYNLRNLLPYRPLLPLLHTLTSRQRHTAASVPLRTRMQRSTPHI